MRSIFLLDSGHGGRLVSERGVWVYTTAPSKMYKHKVGDKFVTIEEGVYNRRIKSELIKLLEREGMWFVDITSTPLDVPLDFRVTTANRLQRTYGSCVYASMHGNAGGGTGFEVWTKKGQDASDPMAEILCDEIIKEFPEWAFRTDKSDADKDKESLFYIFNVTCPVFLSENLFFDNWRDAEYMLTQECVEKVAKAHYKAFTKIERL